MDNTTNLFDLLKTAHAAAEADLGKGEFDSAASKVAAFEAAEHDKRDWPLWDQFYGQHAQTIGVLAKSPAPSALADAAKA